jgi:hypothetical protein
MPIGEQSPITRTTGNGSAKTFAFSFCILALSDLIVRVGNVAVTSGFTVAGLGNRSGGTVTFSTAPAAGVEVLLYRKVSRSRATDYQYAGDLREDVLDDDFDRLYMLLQEDAEVIGRAVRGPLGEVIAELPAADIRAGAVLGFDSHGNPVAVTRTEDGGAALGLALAASSGASLVGYGTGTVEGVINAFTILESRIVVTDAEFGALGNNTGNQAAAIAAAIAKAETIAATKGGCDVIVPAGRYRITAGLWVKRGRINLIFTGGAELVPVGNFDTLRFEHDTPATFIYKNHLVDCVADETGKTGGRALVGRYLAESDFKMSAAGGFDGVLLEAFNTVDFWGRLTGLTSATAVHTLVRGGGSVARSDVLRIGGLVMGGTYVAGQHGLVLDGFVHTVTGHSVYAVNVGGKGFWARNTISAADNPTFINMFDMQTDYCAEAVNLDKGQIANFYGLVANGSRAGDNVYIGQNWTDANVYGGRSTGAKQAGIAVAGSDVSIADMTVLSNSSDQYGGTLGTYPGIIVGSTSSGTRVIGCRSGWSGTSNYQKHGIQIDVGAAAFIVKDNDVRFNVNPGINNGAGTSSTKIVADNIT